MATYGEFIDAIRKTQIIEAKLFLEDWVALATEEQWNEYRPMRLTPELVMPLIEDAVLHLRKRLAGICTDAVYADVLAEGHALLKEILAKSAEFDIVIAVNEVDQSLTLSETLVASGHARIIPGN